MQSYANYGIMDYLRGLAHNFEMNSVDLITIHSILDIYSSKYMVSVIFTARCYASAVLAMGLCLCASVRLSQVGVLLKRQNVGSHKQYHTIPPGTLVFLCQRSPRNSTGVTPYEGVECRWGRQNRRLSTNNRLHLENGKRQTHSFY